MAWAVRAMWNKLKSSSVSGNSENKNVSEVTVARMSESGGRRVWSEVVGFVLERLGRNWL
jgi:glucose-6-phosphate dehydrogenase assembly protein OpcA